MIKEDNTKIIAINSSLRTGDQSKTELMLNSACGWIS